MTKFSNQHHFLRLVPFLPANFYFLGDKGVDGFAGIVGLDRQFAVEAAVYEYTEGYFGGPAKSQ